MVLRVEIPPVVLRVEIPTVVLGVEIPTVVLGIRVHPGGRFAEALIGNEVSLEPPACFNYDRKVKDRLLESVCQNQ